MKKFYLSLVIAAAGFCMAQADEAKPAKAAKEPASCCMDKSSTTQTGAKCTLAGKDGAACTDKMTSCKSTPTKLALLSPKAAGLASR